jgi:chorismate dehydratase
VEPHLRLGRIDYINADPFFAASPPPPGIQLHAAIPTGLNRGLLEGSLDLSWISSVELLRHPDQLLLTTPLCIAAPGAVRSVILASPCAWEDLDGETIWLSSHSATSVALLEVLLADAGFRNDLRVWDHQGALPDGPVLLIGDEALRQGPELRARRVYDLGDRWRQHTGLPMVFAVLALRREVLEDPERLELVYRALEWMQGNGETFSAAPLESRAFATRRAGLDGEGYRRYFEGFQFRWDATTEDGYETFRTRLREHGLLSPTLGTPELYEPTLRRARPLGAAQRDVA